MHASARANVDTHIHVRIHIRIHMNIRMHSKMIYSIRIHALDRIDKEGAGIINL